MDDGDLEVRVGRGVRSEDEGDAANGEEEEGAGRDHREEVHEGCEGCGGEESAREER